MAFYYCYQPQHRRTSLEPSSSESIAPESTTPLPSLLVLSPPQQQQQLTLPMLTPILSSVTSSPSITTNTAITEYNEQQQQLPTPNTFIRHCEDMGLFHDLQNVVIMSPLAGTLENTVTTVVSVATTTTVNTTVTTLASTEQSNTSNLFGIPSSAVLTTMMMANPFDETFKQAVLRQQKKDINLIENNFNNNNNNNDAELNTPFIAATNVLDTTKNTNSILTSEINMNVAAASETEGSIITTLSIPQQQNSTVTTSAANTASTSLIVLMPDHQQQRPHNSIVSIKPHLQNHCIAEQQFIVPGLTTTTNIINGTSMTCHDSEFYDDKDCGENSNTITNDMNESTTVKQVLKQNLLVKQLMQNQPKLTEIHHKNNQQNNDIDIVTAITFKPSDKLHNDNICNDDDCQRKQLTKKQELLERNRTAAKRCRIKRKVKWELLSEENQKLKIENNRLRNIISKLISRDSPLQQRQETAFQNDCINNNSV